MKQYSQFRNLRYVEQSYIPQSRPVKEVRKSALTQQKPENKIFLIFKLFFIWIDITWSFIYYKLLRFQNYITIINLPQLMRPKYFGLLRWYVIRTLKIKDQLFEHARCLKILHCYCFSKTDFMNFTYKKN